MQVDRALVRRSMSARATSTVPSSSPEPTSTIATPSRPAERSDTARGRVVLRRGAGRSVPSGRSAQVARGHEPLARSPASAARAYSASAALERPLVRGAQQVRGVDLLVLVVEDRRLDRAGRGTRRGGGRRTGRARPRPRRRPPARGRGARRGPTSGAARRRCPGTSRRSPRRARRCRCRARARRSRRRRAARRRPAAPRARAAAAACSRRGRARSARRARACPRSSSASCGEARHQLDRLARLHEARSSARPRATSSASRSAASASARAPRARAPRR